LDFGRSVLFRFSFCRCCFSVRFSRVGLFFAGFFLVPFVLGSDLVFVVLSANMQLLKELVSQTASKKQKSKSKSTMSSSNNQKSNKPGAGSKKKKKAPSNKPKASQNKPKKKGTDKSQSNSNLPLGGAAMAAHNMRMQEEHERRLVEDRMAQEQAALDHASMLASRAVVREKLDEAEAKERESRASALIAQRAREALAGESDRKAALPDETLGRSPKQSKGEMSEDEVEVVPTTTTNPHPSSRRGRGKAGRHREYMAGQRAESRERCRSHGRRGGVGQNGDGRGFNTNRMGFDRARRGNAEQSWVAPQMPDLTWQKSSPTKQLTEFGQPRAQWDAEYESNMQEQALQYQKQLDGVMRENQILRAEKKAAKNSQPPQRQSHRMGYSATDSALNDLFGEDALGEVPSFV